MRNLSDTDTDTEAVVQEHGEADNLDTNSSSDAKELSSYKVFLQFVKYGVEEGKRSVDATGILSKECYDSWLRSRRKTPKKSMEAFRRALTAHCRGVDGRRPFPEEVEESLLSELRKKKRWACFEECDESVGLIGVQGFPSRGFHERQRLRREKGIVDEDEKDRKRRRTLDQENIYQPQKFQNCGSLPVPVVPLNFNMNLLQLAAAQAQSGLGYSPVINPFAFGTLPVAQTPQDMQKAMLQAQLMNSYNPFLMFSHNFQ